MAQEIMRTAGAMADGYERTFRVRYHECDAYGHVNNTEYIRYVYQTTLDAEAALGYGIDRLRREGYYWQPASTDIEYLRPVRYGQTVRVEVRISGVRGARLWRTFECAVVETGQVAAQGWTMTRLMGPEGEPPANVPLEIAQSAGGAFVEPERFPAAPEPPAGVFAMRRRVQWQELDMERRVDPARYLDYVEDASFGVIEAYGWPARRMVAEGFAILLRRHQIEYVEPARLDDEIEVATWASQIKRAMATRHYRITRLADGTVLVRVSTLGVWVDLASGRPIRIPDGFMDNFAPNLVP